MPAQTDAVIVLIGSDGTYLDGSQSALDLYGVSRAKFREHRLGDFSPQFGDLVRAEWSKWCLEDRWPRRLRGAWLVRPDGGTVFVDAHFERRADSTIVTHLTVLDPGAPHARATARILDEWRSVERALDRLTGVNHQESLRNRLRDLRAEYQQVFRDLHEPAPTKP